MTDKQEKEEVEKRRICKKRKMEKNKQLLAARDWSVRRATEKCQESPLKRNERKKKLKKTGL